MKPQTQLNPSTNPSKQRGPRKVVEPPRVPPIGRSGRNRDATIECWAKALELRDRETEGHSRRVVEMSVRLARSMGLGREDLIQVRRGSFLHDIGKIGIPDSILLKPGPLDETEWAIMRTHPELAVEILRPIEYLRPALGIPYCHHEKWDGSGYPRGLRAEQIPLEARIFAVVDIWDALGHDRPYRRAWSTDRVIEHIRASAGTHLDPRVVEAFLSLIAGTPTKPGRMRKPRSVRPLVQYDSAERIRLASLKAFDILDTPPEPCYEDIVLLASHLCESPIALVSFVDSDRQWFKAKRGLDESQTSRAVSFCAQAILGSDLFIVPDASADFRFADNPLVASGPKIRFYAGMPLIVPDGSALGTLCVIDRVPRQGLTPEQEHGLRALAKEVVSHLQLRRQAIELERAAASRRSLEVRLSDQLRRAHELNVQLEAQRRDLEEANNRLLEMASTDPLTGLKNRRVFQDLLDTACEATKTASDDRSQKASRFSLVMVDIDSFKKLNDTFGHRAGDEALRQAATLLRRSLRNEDVIARFGGEEFVVFLPNADAKLAGRIAERLRKTVADAVWPHTPLTISLGIATAVAGEKSLRLIDRADQALYHSKRSGRNRVSHFDDLPLRTDPLPLREVG